MKKIIQKIKSSKKIQIILGSVLTVLIVGVIIFYLLTNNRVFIDNSLVTTPVSSITPSAGGTLKNVYVVEGQKVKKGDALALVGSETLYAYTDGIITMTDQQIGGNVTPQTNIIQMINTAEMRIDGVIDENKGLDQVKVGQPVSFTVDALPGKTFWGYIDEVSPTAHQTQMSFSISSERPTQQFDVYARFDAGSNPDVKNGMSAKMTVFTK